MICFHSMASKTGGLIALCSISSHGTRSWKVLSGNKQMTGLLEPLRETTKLTKTGFSEESPKLIHMTSSTGAEKRTELIATATLDMAYIAIAHRKATNAHAPQTTGTLTDK